MAWQVDFYEDAESNYPVERFLDELAEKHRAKLLALIKMLNEYGPTLPFPYSSQVEGKLRELRTQVGRLGCASCISAMRIKFFSYCMVW